MEVALLLSKSKLQKCIHFCNLPFRAFVPGRLNLKATFLNLYAGWGATLRPRTTFEARKALIRLTKSKIWSLIEKVDKSRPPPGLRRF